jgi:hypothetical protein
LRIPFTRHHQQLLLSRPQRSNEFHNL